MTDISSPQGEVPGEKPLLGVSPGRHPSVQGDTLGSGERRLSRSRLWKMLAASLVVHAFLTPGPALLGLISMLPALDLGEREDIVEVDLTSLPMGFHAEEPVKPVDTPAPDSESPAEPEVAPSTEAQAVAPEQAQVEKISPVPAPLPEDPAPPHQPHLKVPESGPPAPTKIFGDPVTLAGSAGEIADSNANVRLMLFTEVVRLHPLGDKISSLLKRTPQWKDFFGPSQIDPVRDVDRVMIAGPQLRNSSQVVAVVQHSLPASRIEQALDGLVRRDGSWIDRGALMARGKADGAMRIFAAPTDNLVIVAPPQLENQIRGMKKGAAFPKSAGDIAVSAYLVSPHRALKGTGILVPETIKWVRLDLRPLKDGGAILKVQAEDQDSQSARNDAELIESLIVQATSMNFSSMGGLGALASLAFGGKEKKWLKSVSFRAEATTILGTIEVTRDQLMMATDLLEAFLPPESSERPQPSAQEAPSGSSAAPAPANQAQSDSEATQRVGEEQKPESPVPEGKVVAPPNAPETGAAPQPEPPPEKSPIPAPPTLE